MKLRTIKKYKTFKKEIAVGRIIEVTNELGQKLIEKGIAEKFEQSTIEIKSIKPPKEAKKVVNLEDNNNNDEKTSSHKNK